MDSFSKSVSREWDFLTEVTEVTDMVNDRGTAPSPPAAAFLGTNSTAHPHPWDQLEGHSWGCGLRVSVQSGVFGSGSWHACCGLAV